jgi:hypothetical protein
MSTKGSALCHMLLMNGELVDYNNYCIYGNNDSRLNVCVQWVQYADYACFVNRLKKIIDEVLTVYSFS